jgi:uncharacterized protein YcbK (DUF882 family)
MMNPCRFVHEDDVIELPPRRRENRALRRAGLSARCHRWFGLGLAGLIALFAFGWVFVLVSEANAGGTPALTRSVTASPLAPGARPEVAFLLDAATRAFVADAGRRGASGEVRVIVRQPVDSAALVDSLPPGVSIEYAPAAGDTARRLPGVSGSGVWNVLLRVRDAVRTVPELAVIDLVPLSEKRDGRIGEYLIGSWPYERGGRPRTPAYAPPAGLIRVTPENRDVYVSRHFRLGDFLTRGQEHVWPKYVAMSPRLLDKLELTIQRLEATGTAVQHVGVISAFRTPSYNADGGDTSGRGALSRHMYGDAMDWFVDNDRDGRMDDLNHDGRVDTGDGRVIVEAAEAVEQEHPSLIGGIGLYAPTGAHAGFVHLDTRGFRARW